MAATLRPANVYGSEGSVPDAVSQGGGGDSMRVQANPNDFGAQVGSAVQNASKEGFDLALKQQGMINETLMTNADAQLAMKIGQIKGAYLQNTGLSAAAAFPKYQSELESARQEARAQLPPSAARGFDMLSVRTIANHIADGSTYAAGQTRQALIDSGTNLQNVNVQAVLDPNVAADPQRVKYHQDTAIHGLQMTLDETHSGLKTNPETGTVSFDESTPQGQALKANYQAGVDNIITGVQSNRFNTLAKGDALGAFNLYQQERDGLPRSTQVHLDSMFVPKVFNANVNNGTNTVLAQSEQEHAQLLYNPSSANAINAVLKNEGGLSPDGHAIYGIDKSAHPEEFAKAKEISNTDGNAAGQAYAKDFYKTQYWDKKGIADLPSNTQTIVMDGVVNHSAKFGDKLIAAAKDGASPQTLIDMRRDEYQRLANADPSKYGENLQGWNSRLDNLQSAQPIKDYGTNENGGPLTLADYYRAHSEDVLQRADAQSEKDMPSDLTYRKAMRETVTNYMNKTVANQSAQYTTDNKTIVRAINGELTNGRSPQTEDDLRSISGVGDVLDRVAAQDPKFAEGIPTMITKMARRNDVSNSPNAYDTIMRTLEPHDQDHPNAISSQDHLDRILGRSDGTGINMKDYNDAKPLLEANQNFKDAISKTMNEITTANGNVDGKGQQRALDWYNQTMAAKKQNDALGDKKIPDSQFIASIGERDGPPMPSPPSRMQQISNWASSLIKSKESQMLTFDSPDNPEFLKLASGTQFKISDGQIRTKK